jgi:GH24 family phage-related lysozyme (muramidase)
MANRLMELEHAFDHKRQPASGVDSRPAGSAPVAQSYGAPLRRMTAQSLSSQRFAPWSRSQTAPPSIPGTALARTKQFEGSVNHMYLDSVGAVTIGVGRMLPDSAAAAELDLVRNGDDAPAGAQEKIDEFATVLGKTRGKLASYYKQYTTLHLIEATIDALLTEDLTRFVGRLAARLPEYDSYPVSVQEALLDMVFNLGETGLMDKFPKFIAAIQRKDWKAAADQCNRVGIAGSRNDETRRLLTSPIAAPGPALAPAP